MQWTLFWWYPMASRSCSWHQTKAFLFCCLSISICCDGLEYQNIKESSQWYSVTEEATDIDGNAGTCIFYWGMFKHWNKLFREVVESSCLEIFKIQMDTILDKLLYLTLHWAEDWVEDLQRLLSQPFCDSVPTEIPTFLNHPNSSLSWQGNYFLYK